MSGAEIINLWGQQGLLILHPTGRLYTNNLDGHGPLREPLRGDFQPLLIPTSLKRLCENHAALPNNICEQANYLLSALNLPWQVDCNAPNRDRWLAVEIERDGRGYLLW